MQETPPQYRARHCTAAACGLRFPVTDGSPLGTTCPLCGAPTEWVDAAYVTHGVTSPDASTPPTAEPEAPAPALDLDLDLDSHSSPGLRSQAQPRLRVEALLDNIRSLRNVGSMFRTADGVGIGHLHLGGVTPTPEHPKLAKTALGAERSVPWSRHLDACAAAARLRAAGRRLWALEGGPRSVSVFDRSITHAVAGLRAEGHTVVLVVGHEVSGVDPRIVDLCERVIHLPMVGIKDSLNVSVALGVAAYTLRFGPDAAASASE